jgi:hypothetical protein
MNRILRYSYISVILEIKSFQTMYYSASAGGSRSLDSWLREITGYLLGGWGSFPDRCADFLRHQWTVDSGTSCLASPWTIFIWLKGAVAWSWTFPSTCSVKVKTTVTLQGAVLEYMAHLHFAWTMTFKHQSLLLIVNVDTDVQC